MNARPTFCLEQALGHRTHGQNLEAAIARRGLHADVIRVEQPVGGARVPWALRGSRDAWSALRRRPPGGPVFFHTQTISLFAPMAAHNEPFVVSVDATPLQVDSMGAWYAHTRSLGALEATKKRWYRSVLDRAAAVVAWSEWAAVSLVNDYGVTPRKLTVAHPGAPAAMFELPRPRPPDGVTRILFVGGDFRRKGGPGLLEAFRSIRRNDVELVVVTEADVEPEPGVRVVRGVTPGNGRLLAELARADLFCLPTLGDCTPVAIEEAMAAGMPVVATRVGAIPETIVEGESGLLVPPGDVPSLADALSRLVDDTATRRHMAEAARERARRHFDAEGNAARIIDLVTGL